MRGSWGERFGGYLDANVLATQRLLEACRGRDLARAGSTARAPASTATTRADAVDETTPPRAPQPLRRDQARGRAPGARSTAATTACRRSACATSRSTARASDPTRRSSASSWRRGPGEAIHGARRREPAPRLHLRGRRGRRRPSRPLERAPVGETLNVARGRTVPLSGRDRDDRARDRAARSRSSGRRRPRSATCG